MGKVAITQLVCPECSTKIYASVSGDARDIVEKECPRCGTNVPVVVDDNARTHIAESAQADAKRTGIASEERFSSIVERHSQDVDEVVADIREAYRQEMTKIEEQSDIPTLEHVKEDIDAALKYIEDDTESVKKIMSVGQRSTIRNNEDENEQEPARRTLRQRARNMIDAKIVSEIANRFLDGDNENAQVIYELTSNVIRDFERGAITKDDLIDAALDMELDAHQMQAVYKLLDSRQFGHIIAMMRK